MSLTILSTPPLNLPLQRLLPRVDASLKHLFDLLDAPVVLLDQTDFNLENAKDEMRKILRNINFAIIAWQDRRTPRDKDQYNALRGLADELLMRHIESIPAPTEIDEHWEYMLKCRDDQMYYRGGIDQNESDVKESVRDHLTHIEQAHESEKRDLMDNLVEFFHSEEVMGIIQSMEAWERDNLMSLEEICMSGEFEALEDWAAAHNCLSDTGNEPNSTADGNTDGNTQERPTPKNIMVSPFKVPPRGIIPHPTLGALFHRNSLESYRICYACEEGIRTVAVQEGKRVIRWQCATATGISIP